MNTFATPPSVAAQVARLPELPMSVLAPTEN